MKQKNNLEIPSLKELLEAGVHFGHQTRRWNPKMNPYIFAKKKGLHIFDLEITRQKLSDAAQALRDIANTGAPIIFVCSKRQAKQMVQEGAESVGAMYVSTRWLGGMLTNFETVRKSLKHYNGLVEGLENNSFSHLTKKERGLIKRRVLRLSRLYGGVKNLDRMPGALVVIDAKREKTSVREAKAKGVPVFALVDSNSDPTGIDYVIPGNDDAYRSVQLILNVLLQAVNKGKGDSVEGKVKSEEQKKEIPRQARDDGKVREKGDKEEGLGVLALGNRALNALAKAGVTTVTQLSELGEGLSEIKGLGVKSVEEIREKLGQKG